MKCAKNNLNWWRNLLVVTRSFRRYQRLLSLRSFRVLLLPTVGPRSELVARLLGQAVARGSLQGLCLCGMGEEALPLLQAAASSYVRSKEASSRDMPK